MSKLTQALSSSSLVEQQHLDWSDKQRRILTAAGMADAFFHPDRGFSFDNSDLPHYWMTRTDNSQSRQVFQQWKNEQAAVGIRSPIVGPWKRVLFYGGWDYTTQADEQTYNFQTDTLFIDLRIPETRDKLLFTAKNSRVPSSIQDLTADQLRYYARQHVFAGFSRLRRYPSNNNHNEDKASADKAVPKTPFITAPFPWSCTRHHVMDWNFVGRPRTRPNQWWIDAKPTTAGSHAQPAEAWKEWAFATDWAGQHYYCEQWERIKASHDAATTDGGSSDDGTSSSSLVLALRMNANNENKDGILIVMGNEFTYCFSHRSPLLMEMMSMDDDDKNDCATPALTSLTDMVDDAVARGDLDTARQWLGSMQGGHGHVHNSSLDNPTHHSWTIDTALEYWKQGTSLLQPGAVTVTGISVEDCTILWNGSEWSVFESSTDRLETLVALFECLHMRRRA